MIYYTVIITYSYYLGTELNYDHIYSCSTLSLLVRILQFVHIGSNSMPSYGLLTNPSNEITSEISKIYDLNFDYVEIGIEGPEGNPGIINKRKDEIVKLLQQFKQEPIAHTAYWIDLGSDYDCIRHAWILEAIKEIKTARELGINLINFHANVNGMFYGQKRKLVLDNMVKSLREIVNQAQKHKVDVMLENVPLSKGVHNKEQQRLQPFMLSML